ncbi:putative lectin-domain receptor-like protein kinase family protein [Panicum miliaceum]|uniref:Lectin-domain receptor-like protein kinase family protein n=1 Tax=Panicum miliaceum TaxID=4540 RepID=A0A3L6Q450_PANMI|nr:putative lectin-domain receptor-like protein kinase family protein [Panicum miliaceum]
MASQIHNKLPFPCFCTILLLLCSPLCCSGRSNQQDYFEAYTLGSAFKETDGLLFLANSSSSTVSGGRVALGSYMETDDPALNLSSNGWFFILQSIFLWKYRDNGTGLNEASFNFRFTMSINQTKAAGSSLAFAIHPSLVDYLGYPVSFPPNPNGASDSGSDSDYDHTSTTVSGSHVSAQISTVYGTATDPRNISLVQIAIESPGNSSLMSNYSVWIDYDHVEHRMSVSVDAVDGTPSTATANAIVKMSDIMPSTASFGFYSSMGQLLQLDLWNLTAERLPYSFSLPHLYLGTPKGNRNIILFSVLGSAAAVAATAAVAYLYFNSKYRRWKKEQDKIAKTMQRLPGVPTQVDYADIERATKSFHETMKLGKGGFGAVYRCTLPAASLRRGRGMEVAVKKFMRDVEDQRYDDFLAEVSIINRLRHKNIVPLVGWSYNKGEPLLIYEYMTNGSLDQHLFRRGSTTRQQQQQQQEETTCLQQWHTRYGIARDIATGLHYVHHEHEPMVLHRDIKASNIMLDSTFRARLGDFGIACTVAVNRSSVTGVAGTFGYIGPDYAMRHKATRQTDIYAFGVLILEVVTGKKNGDVGPDDDHITDWVWRLHREGILLEAAHGVLTAAEHQQGDVVDEARRLLLLGLACTNPNPSDRPSMVEVVQVLTKLAPAPDVPLERPTFVWPPEDWRSRDSVYRTAGSNLDGSSASTVELGQISQEQPLSAGAAGYTFVHSTEEQSFGADTKYAAASLIM